MEIAQNKPMYIADRYQVYQNFNIETSLRNYARFYWQRYPVKNPGTHKIV